MVKKEKAVKVPVCPWTGPADDPAWAYLKKGYEKGVKDIREYLEQFADTSGMVATFRAQSVESVVLILKEAWDLMFPEKG